jgi:hypothetical protein
MLRRPAPLLVPRLTCSLAAHARRDMCMGKSHTYPLAGQEQAVRQDMLQPHTT